MIEKELKRLCILADIPYYPPLTRTYRKVSKYVSDKWYYAHHTIVARLLWIGVKLKIVPFSTFELWCFYRRDRK